MCSPDVSTTSCQTLNEKVRTESGLTAVSVDDCHFYFLLSEMNHCIFSWLHLKMLPFYLLLYRIMLYMAGKHM